MKIRAAHCDRHPREGGELCQLAREIPAFAGMTTAEALP